MKKIYFKKLLMMYTGVLFVLSMVFFSIFFILLEQSEKDKQTQQNKVLFSDYITQQEEKYIWLKRNADKISGFDTLADFALSSGTEYYEKMSYLMTDLRKYSDGVRPTFIVHKYGDDTAITNIQSTKLEMQLQIFGITQKEYDDVLKAFSKSDLQNRRFVFTDKGLLYITTRTIASTRMIVSTFAENWEMEKDYENGIFASYSIVNDNVLDLRQAARTSFFENGALPQDAANGEIFNIHYDGGDYFYAYSNHADVVYYLKNEPLAPTAFYAIVRYLPYALVAFFLSFILVLYMSKKMYEPIDELVNTFTEMQEDKGGQHVKNEIDYLAKQVAKIRHENADLANAVRETYATAKSRFLADLVQGVYQPSQLENDLQRFDLEWLSSVNYFVRVELHILSSDEAGEISSRVYEIVHQQLGSQFKSEFIHIEQGQQCFVVNIEDISVLKDALLKIATVVNTAFGLPVTFYISKPSFEVDKLHYSLMTLEKIYETRSLSGRKTIYDFSDVKGKSNTSVLYPVTTEQKLISCVENGNLSGVEQTLAYIFKEYGSALEVSQTRSVFVSALANTLSRCAQRLSANVEKADFIDMQSIFRTLQVSRDVAQLKQKTMELLQDMLSAAGERQIQQTHGMKKQIEAYVKENLKKEISLITMADAFRLTPNYMSAVFKDAMGETFKDYTSRVRFDTGVEALRENPDLSTTELAEIMGLNNGTTLVRLFKKYAGCSPNVYVRNNILKS